MFKLGRLLIILVAILLFFNGGGHCTSLELMKLSNQAIREENYKSCVEDCYEDCRPGEVAVFRQCLKNVECVECVDNCIEESEIDVETGIEFAYDTINWCFIDRYRYKVYKYNNYIYMHPRGYDRVVIKYIDPEPNDYIVPTVFLCFVLFILI